MINPKLPERLYFRLYPTYIEGAKQQLRWINKYSFYRISVWSGQQVLGEMMEGASPAILHDKIYLTKALINFTLQSSEKDITIKLVQHYTEDRHFGEGVLNLSEMKRKYSEHGQKYNSQQEVILNTVHGKLKLVFSIFIETDRFQLDQYIRRFKQNQKNVMKAKRNINIYKREILNKSAQRERPNSKGDSRKRSPVRKLSDIKQEIKNQSGVGEGDESPRKGELNVQYKADRRQKVRQKLPGTYLQINSAARFHTKNKQKINNIIQRIRTQNEQRQIEASSQVTSQYGVASKYYISAMNIVAAPSLMSDGSQASLMRLNNQRVSYSDKAVKKFEQKINVGVNILSVIVAIWLIYFVIAPSTTYSKM